MNKSNPMFNELTNYVRIRLIVNLKKTNLAAKIFRNRLNEKLLPKIRGKSIQNYINNYCIDFIG
jgi:hypothetical protein